MTVDPGDAMERRERRRTTRRRVDREERKVTGEVFDQSTYKTLYDLSNRQIITAMGGVVSTGKEANIFHALGGNGRELAVKIYRIATADFNAMQEYIYGDPRFGHVGGTRRKLVYAWTRKEYSNLARARDAGVRVPEPLAFQNNVLVMEFIGRDEVSAPRLKDVGAEQPAGLMKKLVMMAATLYQKAGLVHADLSEYNVLMWEDEPVLIDMGQSVLLDHPRAQAFLRRDIANLSRYFSKLGVQSGTVELLDAVRGA